MKIRPYHPVFIFVCLFVPRRWFNTYVQIDVDKCTFSRYFLRNRKFRKEVTDFYLNKVIEVGTPTDFHMKRIEETASGSYGSYIPMEIIFKLIDGQMIPLNVRPYNKCQIKHLLSLCTNADVGKHLHRIL